MGIYIGLGVASSLGGFVTGWANGRAGWTIPLLGQVRSWQMVFFARGTSRPPGRAANVHVRGTRSPRRPYAAKNIPFREVFTYIKDNRKTYLCHHLGIAFLALAGYGALLGPPVFRTISPLDSGGSRKRFRHCHGASRVAGRCFWRLARRPARDARPCRRLSSGSDDGGNCRRASGERIPGGVRFASRHHLVGSGCLS